MEQSERLERAEQLAPTLAEPPADNKVGKAFAAGRTQLSVFRIAWVAIFAVMVVGSITAGAGVFALLWLVAVGAIFWFGWTSLRRQIDEIDRRLAAPLKREAVAILDKQPRGRNRAMFVTVANRAGHRRELAVPSEPGLVMTNDVGVLFSRADVVWQFHRVD